MDGFAEQCCHLSVHFPEISRKNIGSESNLELCALQLLHLLGQEYTKAPNHRGVILYYPQMR